MLRLALGNYIKQNLSQEDKIDLFNDVKREIRACRHLQPSNKTIPEFNEEGVLIKTVEEIEADSEFEIIKNWGININR